MCGDSLNCCYNKYIMKLITYGKHNKRVGGKASRPC